MAENFAQTTPKNNGIHSSRYYEFIGSQLWAIEFNEKWNNFYPQMEAIYKLILQVEDSLLSMRTVEDGVTVWHKPIIDIIKYPFLTPRTKFIHNFKQVWDGGCKITKQRDPNNPTSFIKGSERFHYDITTLNPSDRNEVSFDVPALDNMTPVGSSKTDEWGVRISEGVVFLLAFDECQYDTVIRDGKFFYTQGGKRIAKFQQSDMKSITKKTYRVGRPFHNKFSKLLKNKALANWSYIANDYHKLIQYLEQGIDDDSEYSSEHSGKSVIGALEE